MTVPQWIELYNKWETILNNLKRSKEAEEKMFKELKDILREHPELGNRDAVTQSLKLKIAEGAIKKYNSGV